MSFFYKGELVHIFISIFTITLAFSINFLQDFFLVLFTVGLGFFLHEMGHKAAAIRYGAVAVYRAWMWGLVMAVFLAAATHGRFVFAAPGAVYIWKENLTRREDGIISLAGPVMNVLLAVFFFYLLYAFGSIPLVFAISVPGIYVNLFLALFNLIPVYPLDGSKVWAYNPGLWALVTVPLGIAFLLLL